MYWKLPSLLVAVASVLQVADAQSTSHEPLHELDYVTSVDGNLSTTLVVDQFFYDNTANSNVGTAFWTRLYNADAALSNILQPGPVLKFKAGDTVEVVFVNNLGPEHTTHTGSINSYHYANKSNLHTHGLHVTAEDPQDNVLKTVDPQTTHTYRYSIPDDHAGGTFWYHAHHHGSTSIQVGGGLVGAIIVEDDPDDIPPQIYNLPELVLILSHNPMNELKSIGESFATGDDLTTSLDNTFPASGPGSSVDEIFVNGQNRPEQQLETGKWGRIRMIFSSLSTSIRLEMSNNDAQCEWHLLAKDGIYVNEAPRPLGLGEYSNGTVYMGSGNRVDVVIRCHAVGTMTLAAVGVDNADVSQDEIMQFDVLASADAADGDLPRFNPYRPDYLADVYTSTNVVSQIVDFKGSPGSCTINNMAWDGSTPTGYIETGSIQEWEVKGNARHPFHLHVNSYQLGTVTGSDDGYFQDGDWHDVVMTPGTVTIGKYVFSVDTFVTKSVLHCHFLTHEDLGCMGYFEHTDSVAGVTTGLTGHGMTCTGQSTGNGTYTTECVSDDAASPTIMPTLVHMDTLSPTVTHMDTLSPTVTHMDTLSPTMMHMDTMSPTTVHPGSMNPTMNTGPGSMNPTMNTGPGSMNPTMNTGPGSMHPTMNTGPGSMNPTMNTGPGSMNPTMNTGPGSMNPTMNTGPGSMNPTMNTGPGSMHPTMNTGPGSMNPTMNTGPGSMHPTMNTGPGSMNPTMNTGPGSMNPTMNTGPGSMNPTSGNPSDVFVLQDVVFGNYTTFSARRNKNEWMSDIADICPNTAVQRFSVLSIKTVAQSPSEDVMNLALHLQHRRQTIAQDRAFLKLTIKNQYGDVFSEEQNLFTESGMLTHYTPSVDLVTGKVNADLKIGLQVDFTQHSIYPKDMSYDAYVEVGIVSANDPADIKVYDCVKVSKSGVAGGQVAP